MKALFICGSMNQTRMMHQISMHLPEFEAFFTPYYCDGFVKLCLKAGILNFSVMAGQFYRRTMAYLNERGLPIDYEGRSGPYQLVITCSDLIVQKNIRGAKVVLVQEGMTDPEGLLFYLVKYFSLPRWLGSTSGTGLSDAYEIFCVASEGFKEFFIKKGVNANKIRATGIPNFDNCISYLDNNFPYRDYVLVATSDRREIYRYENRKKFIEKANQIADGRELIFKIHPNENTSRARQEIERYSPKARIYCEGNAEHMVANCAVLVTRFSSVCLVASVLGKMVFSDISNVDLARLRPIQNKGRSAMKIASECRKLFQQ